MHLAGPMLPFALIAILLAAVSPAEAAAPPAAEEPAPVAGEAQGADAAKKAAAPEGPLPSPAVEPAQPSEEPRAPEEGSVQPAAAESAQDPDEGSIQPAGAESAQAPEEDAVHGAAAESAQAPEESSAQPAAAGPAPPAADPRQPSPTPPTPLAKLSRTLSWERIPLPPGEAGLQVEVDALERSVILQGASAPRRLAGTLSRRPGSFCPETRREGDRVILRCNSRRIEATLAQEGGKRYLDLHELRGLPNRPAPEAAPWIFWDPVSLGLGDACPGTVAFSRGECALAEGREGEAIEAFEEATRALDTAAAAWIRLGDLASRAGDAVLAAERYARAGRIGPWGRIATARICELFGGCLGTPFEARIFDDAGIPEPARSELVLRGARALAFREASGAAAARLARHPAACALGELLCARIALDALRSEREEESGAGLGLYLILPDRSPAPIGYELAVAAALVSARMGAPLFAANTLATAVELAPQATLSEHLQRTAALFLEGEDPIRAAVVLDFSAERLGRGALASSSWKALIEQVGEARRAPETEASTSFDARAEVEAALEAARRAALLRRSQESDAAPARNSQEPEPRGSDASAPALGEEPPQEAPP